MNHPQSQFLYLGQEQLLSVESAQATSVIDPAEQVLVTCRTQLLNLHLLLHGGLTDIGGPLGLLEGPLRLGHLQREGWPGEFLQAGRWGGHSLTRNWGNGVDGGCVEL